jgi:hypothetical protein
MSIGEQRVLTHAMVLKRLANGGHTEKVARQIYDTDGNPVEFEEEVTITHYAEPGEVIDVSQWSWVESYVNLGMIQLLTPDQVEAYEAKHQRRGTKNERSSTTG